MTGRPTLRLKKPSKRFAKPQRRPTGPECLTKLAEHFPHLFRPDDPKPLAIGIHKSIRDDIGLSGAKIRRGLREWTRSVAYLCALAEGGPRYDINGNVDGEISGDAIEGARERLGALDASEDGG